MTMKQNIVLFGHGGSYNHGCEAIVRSTVKMLADGDTDISLYSNSVPSDQEFGLSSLAVLHEQRNPFRATRPGDVLAMVRKKFLKQDGPYLHRFFEGKMEDVRDSLCISVGGDMYCYGRLPWLYYIHDLLWQNGNKTVLWGCSVNEDSFFPEAVADLKKYDEIIVREPISFGLFKEHGFQNVQQYPDPAFVLDPEEVTPPFPFQGENTVAVNISPLMARYKGNSPFEDAVYHLLTHLLKNTGMDILFVPHVNGGAEAENDYGYMKTFLDRYHSPRIQILGREYNCRQLKYIISQCRFLVTARTHASIAAYSTGVPTLVLGYSVKSRGIARDIFGTEEKYVLPVQSLLKSTELTDAFEWLTEQEKSIRAHLAGFMPGYTARAYEAAKTVKALMGEPSC